MIPLTVDTSQDDKKARRASRIYIVQADGSGRVKIGVSHDVAKRLTDIQNQCADQLVLIAVIDAECAALWERALHSRFGAYREHGEWFRPGPELVDFISSLSAPPEPDLDTFYNYRRPALIYDRVKVADMITTRRSGRRKWTLPAGRLVAPIRSHDLPPLRSAPEPVDRVPMTPADYKAALKALGLSQVGAGRLMGVSARTAQEYAAKGPSGPAAFAVRLLLALPPDERAKWLAP